MVLKGGVLAILVTGLFCLDVISFSLPSLKEEWLVFVVMGLGVLDDRGLDCLSFLSDVDGYAGIWQGCCSLSLFVGMRPFLFFYYFSCFLE